MGKALDWYMELPLKSIDSYQATADAFVAKFGTAIQTMQDERILTDIKQSSNESLSNYHKRCNDLLVNIPDVTTMSLIWRFLTGSLMRSLRKLYCYKLRSRKMY
ncbi:hypothetical protein LIER_44073 [Lithospermum erythrorhizon]|uniref:Retrotransposon gag domain-containing protein n=1 Tax=Lithospermum erythrorhizon TaxID=34254 RepID=A0AAV3P7S7_LITER